MEEEDEDRPTVEEIKRSKPTAMRKDRLQERRITGDKSTSQEIDGVVPARQSRCKHVWAPSPAGDGHGMT